jgi:hypothetical protein
VRRPGTPAGQSASAGVEGGGQARGGGRIAGVSIYRVFPTITEVFAFWPRLSTLDPRWFTLAVAAEIAHFTCTFALQRLALRTKAWFPVITS